MMSDKNSRILWTFLLLISVFFVSLPAHAQFSGGTGEPNDPYQIATVEQLALMGNVVARFPVHFELVEDIYLDPNLPFDRPIIDHFDGFFDGNDHIISNLTIRSQSYMVGLFGELDVNAVVTDLGIVDVNITALYHPDGYAGGMVGRNGGSISSCYVTGKVDGEGDNVGGLIGSNSGDVNDCWSDGTVTEGGSNVGGLIGSNGGNVFDCWSTGTVTKSGGNVGGLIGSNGGDVNDCWSDGTVRKRTFRGSPSGIGPWTSPAFGAGGLIGVNDANITGCDSSCDLETYWHFKDKYNTAVGGLVGINSGTIENGRASGSVEGLENVGGLVGSNGTSTYHLGKSYLDTYYTYSGGSILKCHATGEVTGKATDSDACASIGGLVGYGQGDMIYMSYALGDVTGGDNSESIGGLVGEASREKIVCCYAEGKVQGRKYVGGLLGWNGGDVANSYARGNVSGYDVVGGLIGSGGKIMNSYATGKITSLVGWSFKGWVHPPDLGGLVGLARNHAAEHCYYLDPNSHYSFPPSPFMDIPGILNNGIGEPLTDVQMKREGSFESWDFVDEIENGTEEIWWILEGQDYPRLWWEPRPNDSNEPVIPDDAFVDINDPGIPGHEGFNGEMCKYEITNAQYCQYLNAALSDGLIVDYNNLVFDVNDTDHTRPYFIICNDPNEKYSSQIEYNQGQFAVRNRTGYNMAEHPVVEVSWYGATAFCDYYGYRLPTEWEWQAVADHDGSYIYGCGTGIVDVMANYDLQWGPGPSGLWYDTHTSPVGFYSPFGYGMCDMAGNVWEWTSSISGNSGVIRGGSWRTGRFDCMVGSSTNLNLDSMSNEVGFRVCR